jgi:predicted DsbA family dithiol-disulfide isomerase
MPFYLNNDNLPDEGLDLRQYISQKYGTRAEGMDQMFESMRRTGEKVGIKFNASRKIVPTHNCHRIMHWVNDVYGYPAGDALMENMFKFYFEDGSNVNKKQIIMKCIESIPEIDRKEAEVILDNKDKFKSDVDSFDQHAKRKLNVHAVPYFIVEKVPPLAPIKFSGAQVLIIFLL